MLVYTLEGKREQYTATYPINTESLSALASSDCVLDLKTRIANHYQVATVSLLFKGC